MRAINLLPRDQGQKTIRKESLPVLVGACSGVLVAAALGAMFMMGSGKVASQQHLQAPPRGSRRWQASRARA